MYFQSDENKLTQHIKNREPVFKKISFFKNFLKDKNKIKKLVRRKGKLLLKKYKIMSVM